MERRSSKPGRLLLAIVVLVSCVGCDQATKQLATHALRGQPPRSYLASTLRLEYAENPGGFLSLGATLPRTLRMGVFTVTNAALLAGVCYGLVKSWHAPLPRFVALVVFLAGGLGNLIDRLLNDGLVTDFAVLGIGPLQTGIINVADVALTLGGIGCAVFYRRDYGAASAGKAER